GVHDRDRGAADGELVERRESRLERAAEGGLDGGAHRVERHGRPGIEAGAELVRRLVAEEPGRRGDELPELDVGRTELLEGQAERARVGVLGDGPPEETAAREAAEVPPGDAEGPERPAPELAAARPRQGERDGPRVRRRTVAHAVLVRAMKSTTTRASASPLSSWRKWPAPAMVVCGWPSAAGTACEDFRQARKAGPGGRSPVGRKVLAATIRANRSGCSAARRRPMSPPQSWPTSVTFRSSSCSSMPRIHSTWRW